MSNADNYCFIITEKLQTMLALEQYYQCRDRAFSLMGNLLPVLRCCDLDSYSGASLLVLVLCLSASQLCLAV